MTAARAPGRTSRAPGLGGTLRPGEDRGVSLVIDPAQVPPGSPVEVTADAGLRLKFWQDTVPEPNRSGWSVMRSMTDSSVAMLPRRIGLKYFVAPAVVAVTS